MSEITLEQGNKRLLSPESANLHTPSVVDKRQRQDSLIEDIELITGKMDGNKEGESDLKSWMLGNLAKKIDFATMNDRIDAQGEEIKQIREKLTQYKKDFDGLRLVFDRSEAFKVRQHRSMGHRGFSFIAL